MTETNQSTTFKPIWALVELMGHTRVAGRISEESHFGTALMRCDIPTGPGENDYFTQWYGGNAIFRVAPLDEATARQFAAGHQPRPVQVYELRALPNPVASFYEDDEDDEDDDF